MISTAAVEIIAVLFFFVCILDQTNAAHSFPAHRLVQWSQGGSNFGSQRAYVNLQASTSVKGVGRRMVVLTADDYATLWKKNNNSISFGAKLDGLLLVLPAADSRTPMPNEWPEIENQLVHSSVPQPVYFTTEDESLKQIRESMAQSGEPMSNAMIETLTRDAWLLSAAAVENEKIAGDIPLVNLQGWLAGDGLTATGDALPTVAVVAHYDSFAAAPGLARGANCNAAGLTALLEISRLFSKLFSAGGASSSAPKFNLLFLLSAAGKHNFAGARHWISAADQRLLDTVEVVVCLDSVAGSSLYLHSSKTAAKEPRVQEVFDAFASASKMLKVPFEIIHKKINLAAPEMSWEHEHFARKKLFALTISAQREPHSPLGDSNLFDTPSRVDMAQLERNIQVIAEGLARVMYPVAAASSASANPLAVFGGSYGTNAELIKSWVEAASAQSRFALFMKKESPLIAGMERALANDGKVEVRRSSFQLPQDSRKFFGAAVTTFTASLTKSILFEVVLFAAVLAYLFGLSVFLGGTTFLSNMKTLSAKAVRRTPAAKSK